MSTRISTDTIPIQLRFFSDFSRTNDGGETEVKRRWDGGDR